MTIRVGIIGTGIMGTDHARTLHRFVPGCTVAMLSDVDVERAKALAGELGGANVTAEAHALIQSSDVDAVLIASNDTTHAEYVLSCLEARKPVLCEKPLAPTSAECHDIIAAQAAVVGDGNALVSVGFMRRFDPGYVELKELLQSGVLGAPLMVHSTGRGVSAPSGSSELTVTGSAIHDIDITPWLLDSEIVEVSWQAPRCSPEVTDRQDPQFILMRSADGVLISVEIFVNARYGYDTRCEVVGSLSSASISEPNRIIHDQSLSHGYAYGADWRPRFADSYRLQSTAWIASLSTGRPSPLATAEDGLQAALVAEAVIASMYGGGAWVQVPGASALGTR